MPNKKKWETERDGEEPLARDWAPIRQGNIYCSPACGGREATCTWDKYQYAKRSAEELARKLGPGWTPITREHRGWHWAVMSTCGHVQVTRQKRKRRYEAWVSLEPRSRFGDWVWRGCSPGGWYGSGDTPMLAISAAIGNLRAKVASRQAVLDKCLAVFAKTGPGKPR